MQIPGNEEFGETIRYFGRKIEVTGVKLVLGLPNRGSMLSMGPRIREDGVE